MTSALCTQEAKERWGNLSISIGTLCVYVCVSLCGSSSSGVVSVDEEAIRAASMKRAACRRSKQDFRRIGKRISERV